MTKVTFLIVSQETRSLLVISSQDLDSLRCHAISHPAGLWMGIHVPGLGQTAARDVTPVTQFHLIAHIDTAIGRWFGVGFDPNGDFSPSRAQRHLRQPTRKTTEPHEFHCAHPCTKTTKRSTS